MRHKNTVVKLYKMGHKQPVCGKAAQIIVDQLQKIRELEFRIKDLERELDERD